MAALVRHGFGGVLKLWLSTPERALSRKKKRYKGETIIRIRIRTPIIRIRTADTRILRIIRISSREELPETTATALMTESRNACYGNGWQPRTAQGGALGGLFIFLYVLS